MAFQCKLPKDLSLHGNISENWRKFKQSFDIFLKASGNINKPSEIIVAILLMVGEEGVALYNTFLLQEAEKNDLAKVLQCFEERCKQIKIWAPSTYEKEFVNAKKRSIAINFFESIPLSPELAAEQMTRYKVMQKIWSIIKERNLYDHRDKQFAICDEELMKVIGVKRFRPSDMMKYLEKHFLV